MTRFLHGIPETVRQLARAIAAVGGQLWIVGGWVRDNLLERSPRDMDLVCFGLEAETLDRLLRSRGGLQLVGKAFPVRKWFAGGLAHDVQLAPAGGDLSSDAAQRDLRIHALYCDPATGEVRDPTGGLADLESRVLHIVGPSFSTDPVRKLRLVRACASLGAEAADEAWERARGMVLSEVARERIFEELRALLRHVRGLERVPELWRRAGLAIDWPELELLADPARIALTGRSLVRVTEDVAELPEPLLEVLAFLSGSITDAAQRCAWLARILDENVAAEVAARVQRDERLEELSAALAIGEEESWFPIDLELVQLQRKHGSLRAALSRLETRAAERGDTSAAAARVRHLTLDAPKLDPWITGRDLQALGLKPGPTYGPLLDRALTHQLRGDWADRTAAKSWLVQVIAREGGVA